jgi:hypothetical protein
MANLVRRKAAIKRVGRKQPDLEVLKKRVEEAKAAVETYQDDHADELWECGGVDEYDAPDVVCCSAHGRLWELEIAYVEAAADYDLAVDDVEWRYEP